MTAAGSEGPSSDPLVASGFGSTIEDVARAAGVSTATVSRALRGHPNVTAVTRQRVEQAADRLRYVANPIASRLASGKTRTIGLIAPQLTSWYTSEVTAGVEETLAEAGYDLLVHTAATEVRSLLADGRTPFRQRVDGMLLVDVFCGENGAEQIAGWGLPAVVLGETLKALPSLAIDNVEGGRIAGRHVAALGHRSVALVTGHMDRDVPHEVALDRSRGFVDELGAAGVCLPERWVVDGDFTIDGGRRAVQTLIAESPRPTAIFLLSDEMAFGALHALRDAELMAGRDVSVMGFDNHPVGEAMGLTTVAQPVRDMGRQGALMMLQAIEPWRGEVGSAGFVPELRLVARSSTVASGG